MSVPSFSKKSFTTTSFTTTDYEAFWGQSNLLPYRAKILIYDREMEELLHEFNSFSNNNDINIQYAESEYQFGSTGTFNLNIEDREHNIDRTKVGNGSKVIMAIAKRSQGPWKNICSGFIRSVDVNRDMTSDGLKYYMSGYGSAIIFSETVTDFTRTNTRPILGSNMVSNVDTFMQVCNMARDLCTDTQYLSDEDLEPIVDRGPFTMNGISSRVRDFMKDFQVRYSPASTVMSALTESSGSYWGVDPYDDIYLRYPWENHSEVTIKTFDAATKANDDIFHTSYFYGPWGYTQAVDISTGFANELIGISGSSPKPIQGEVSLVVASPESGTPLAAQDVIQKINIKIPQCDWIQFLLKKVGVVTDQWVLGVFYSDDDGKPSKHKIATFRIAVKDIPQDRLGPVTVRLKKVVHHLTHKMVVWCQLTHVGTDEENTVIWQHNGIPSSLSPVSGVRPVEEIPPHTEGLPPFKIDPNSPTYTFATFYDVRTKIVVKDPISIARYGDFEAFVDVSNWTTDFKTVSSTLMAMLRYTSRPTMVYHTDHITIPDTPLTVGQSVNILDPASGLDIGANVQADVLRVRYEFDTEKTEAGIGTFLCEVDLQGLYDFLAIEGMPDLGYTVPEELSYDVLV